MIIYFKCRMQKQRPSIVTGDVMVLQLTQETPPSNFVLIVTRSIEEIC